MNFKKITIKFLIFVFTFSAVFNFVLAPKQAQAIPVEEVGPVGVVIGAGIPIIAAGTGVPGTGYAAIAAAKVTIGATCTGIIKALETADSVEAVSTLLDTTSAAAFDIIGGGSVEALKASGKIVKATAAKECVDAYIIALEAEEAAAGPLSDTITFSNPVGNEKAKFNGISNSLRTVIENLKEQQTSAVKEILKAFVVRLVLNLNKNLTTSLVNKMVDKYKISDYLKYSDAVATQVYSMKYINENFQGDARQQMMVRALLQSELLPERAKTAQAFATSQAQEYLGKACGATSTPTFNQDLSSYIKCLSAYGSSQANPNYYISQAIDQASAAKVAGKANASAEISQGAGFAPPRDCKGSLAVQKQIDAKFDKVAKDKLVAMETVARLKNALSVKPPRTTQEEYNRALQALDQAEANSKTLEKQSDSPIIDICEAIVSPGSFVSNSINKFLNQHIDQTSQIKGENLPFYATFLADVTSNFLTNILTGGKSNSQILKEAGTSALNGALTGLSSSIPNSTFPGGTAPIAPTTTGSTTSTSGTVKGDNIVLPRGPNVSLR